MIYDPGYGGGDWGYGYGYGYGYHHEHPHHPLHYLSVRRVSTPATEPISLAEARLFLRQDVPGYSGDTMQDTLLQSWIRAARYYCEGELDKVIGAQQYVVSMPTFTSMPYWLQAPKPVRSIEQIRYKLASDTDYTVMDPTTYYLTQSGDIALQYGELWPSAGNAPDSVLIDYTAGMAYIGEIGVDTETLDEDVLVAMRLLIGHFWFNRAAVEHALSRSAIVELPMGVKDLLWGRRSSIGV
jgi:uncharacterized phiE125 gp8 family phage protein